MSAPTVLTGVHFERYEDYKHGWLAGASGKPLTAMMGTPEPKHRDWFDRGFDDGLNAFQSAMRKTYEALG
ncbi:MAG: hypothetical protein OK454_02910 [Thaumarchaeota archaeon]|nr:hypothetical protein [Nitrososphaerota archaeon]